MPNQWVVPFLEAATIRARAESLIAEYHASRQLPIPIEDIIDPGMGIEIVPVPGLRTLWSDEGVDAFVTSSLTQITVDEFAYKNQTNRYRFSLAHELGHILLHHRFFSQLAVASTKDWREAVTLIPKREYAKLEWQANCFAGHVLVPTRELSENLQAYRTRIMEEGLDPHEQTVRPFIEKHLAAMFGVSSQVIHRRIEAENL